MIFHNTFFPKFLRPGYANVIDWSTIGTISSPLGTSIAWTTAQPIGFGGTILRWGNNGSLYGAWGTEGNSGGGSTGNLQYIWSGDSDTFGSVTSYNDGIINVNTFSTRADVKTPALVKACIGILKQSPTAKNRKLDVMKNGQLEFTLRSVIWGTRMTTAENEPDYQAIDKQFADSSQQAP